MDHTIIEHGILGTLLDTLFLAGILITAILTIFKAGRWFGGIMDSINHLTDSMDKFKACFEQHTRDEDQRFASVEQKMSEHSRRISDLREELKKLHQALPAELNVNGTP